MDRRVVRAAPRGRHALRRRALRQRARLVRVGDPDLPPADRARRPGHRHEPGDDAVLHDDPRGVVARRAGRRHGRARPGLRARHGRAGEDPRPREADDPPLRPERGRQSRSSSPARAPARRCTRCCGTRARPSARPRIRRSCARRARRSTPRGSRRHSPSSSGWSTKATPSPSSRSCSAMVAEPVRTGREAVSRRYVALAARFRCCTGTLSAEAELSSFRGCRARSADRCSGSVSALHAKQQMSGVLSVEESGGADELAHTYPGPTSRVIPSS